MKTDDRTPGYALNDLSQNLAGVFQQFGPYLFDKANPFFGDGTKVIGCF